MAKKRIKDLPKLNRPWEKLIAKGAEFRNPGDAYYDSPRSSLKWGLCPSNSAPSKKEVGSKEVGSHLGS